MKKILILIAVTLLILVAYVGLKPSTPVPQGSASLPWDIITDGTGYSRVFGIDLGRSTLQQISHVLGEDHEVAIISDSQDNTALELYASHFKSGPLSAKLIVGFDADAHLLMSMKEQADHKEYMASGSRKFLLNEVDLQAAQHLKVRSISFIPAARLDEGIVTSRFGAPADKIQVSETETHYLYPEKGLDIVINSEAKDRLQYVAPKDFWLLEDPLKAK